MSMAGPPDHSGFLQKVGGKFVSVNQTRYFELRGTNLFYYKTRPAAPGAEEPQGVVDIRNARCVDVPGQKNSWTVTGPALPKTYTLIAATDADKRAWIERIHNPNTTGASQYVPTRRNESDDEGHEESSMVYTTGKKISTNDFDVISVVGKGAFGRVMQVRKKDTGEIFAMKEMSKELVERENLMEHMFAEKAILQKVKHPFIVSLHYAFQTKDKLYLILDFLSGGELFFHLQQVGRFEESRAKFYTAQIGLAIGHLHGLNIIYRDLKPENCVLDRDGNVCLTDFGLAKTNVQGSNAVTFCGTPEYLAPEFLMGGGHGKAVDWWSLGILMYEMLCGIPPFYSENVNEMYELILKKPLMFDDDVVVSPEAEDLLRKLLDRNPSRRLQRIEDFVAHPFFRDIDFEALFNKQIPPPFQPASDANQNFDPEFTAQEARLSQRGDAPTHLNIAGFTYQGGNALDGH